MIRHVASRREDRVSDAVGCLRLFGGLFVCTGTFALGAAILGWGGLDSHPVVERLAVAFIGAMHLAGGLVVGWGRSIRTRATRAGVEWEERRPFRGTARRTFSPSEIRGLRVLAEHDSDGDEVFRVALVLGSGETLPLSQQATPSGPSAHDIRDAVARRIGAALLD